MKLRIPTMLFKPESYKDLKLFKDIIKEGDTLSINLSFFQFGIHDQAIVVEDIVLDCDAQQILDTKRAELLKIAEEIEALEKEIIK